MRRFLSCLLFVVPLLFSSAVSARLLTRNEELVLNKISDAYNGIKSLEAGFAQIGPDGQITEGRVYIKKPGLMRFEYAPPAPTLVVSDGLDIAVFNTRLHTVDRYPLSATPLNLLLAEHVSFSSSQAVTGVEQAPGQIIVDARATDRRTTGNIQIVFTDPGYELRQWSVTDAQGLTTTVTLRNMQTGVAIPDSIFSLRGNKTQP
ncbi:MAG TPA: outer membrane lipoprotein carrier protein LolA [Rhizomicrobium sp.]|jgi:outer membrane lipoprotein-sorting protein